MPHYWVIDLDGRRVVVHSEPRDSAYGRIEVVGADGELRAASAGVPPLSVAELLAAAGG